MTVVVHVTEKLERHGGTPRKLLYLVQNSDPARQRHCFVTFVPGNLDEEMRASGATVICAGSADVHRVTRSLLTVARREHAQLISTHFTRSLVCGVAVGRLLRLPVIHNAHGPASEAAPAGLAGRLGRIFSRWSYPVTTLVTANSRFTAGSLQRVFGIPEQKIRVVPCPVVPRGCSGSREVPGLPPRDPRVLRLVTVGGLIPVRRQHLLVSALVDVLRAGVDAELLMVGDGPLKPALVAQSQQLGVASRIRWLGFRDDIGDVLAASDLYVSATATEGFGIAVVEAMMQGVPVVLADGGSHPELIDGSRHGELFDPDDAHDLARRVVALWFDERRRAILTETARAHAERNFTPQRFAERYRDVLSEARTA